LSIIETVLRILNARGFGSLSVLLLAFVPVFWKIFTIATVNVPVDSVWMKASASVVTYAVLAAVLTGIAGLMRDKKKVVAGLALLLSTLGGFYLAAIELFSVGFWP